jgi:hypothetical protein
MAPVEYIVTGHVFSGPEAYQSPWNLVHGTPVGSSIILDLSPADEALMIANDLLVTRASVAPVLPPGGSGLPDVIAHCPLWAISTANGALTTNRMYFMRVVITRTGHLRDLSIYVLTASGNALGAVYDCGEASSGNRTRLWGGTSTPLSTGNAWQSLGDPNLTVAEGQMVDLVFMADNATATFPRGGSPNATFGQLPTNFATSPGGAPAKLCPIASPGSFAMPTTVAESSITSSVQTYPLIARIS